MDEQLKSGVAKDSIVGRVRQYTLGAADKQHIFLSSEFPPLIQVHAS